MRMFVLLLLLANLAFYAWWRYLAPFENAGEPSRLAGQIDPQKLPVVAAPREATRPAAQAGACLEWGSFAAADLPRAEQALLPLALRVPPVMRATKEAAWWVYIPSLGSRDAAQKKVAELKTLGVAEHFIVQEEGALRWAISLGIFTSEALAQARLEELQARRVRSAQLGTREVPTAKTWLQARGLDAEQAARLAAISKQFEGTELRECASSRTGG